MVNIIKSLFQLAFWSITLLSSPSLFAQTGVVKVNPFNPILGRYTIGTEVKVGEHSSASLFLNRFRLNYDDFKFRTGAETEIKGDFLLSSWGAMSEYRYYLSEQPLKGFYLGGYGNYARMRSEVSVNGGSPSTTGSADFRFNNYGLGGMLGYQFLIKDRFAIDLFGGLGGFWFNLRRFDIVYQDNTIIEEKIPVPIAGLFPRLGINLGIAF